MDTTGARYRIQAVSEMTGVSTATLRAWERRYGFPTPGRSAAAYRLYSSRDVDLVRRMQALLEDGLSPSEAARQLLDEAPVAAPAPVSEDLFDLAAKRIIAAVETLDATALQSEIRRALMLDSGLVAFQRILQPALIEIGTLWEAGKISVASEHFASHLIATALLDLLRLTAVPADAERVLLACFAEEQHVIPLYGVALEAASWGYRPLVLGARTPPSAVARGIEATRPAWVGLSLTISPTSAGAARELVDGYADACRDVPWIVGGAGVGTVAAFVEARGGHVMPADGDAARALVDRLVGAQRGSELRGARPVAQAGGKAPRGGAIRASKRAKQGRA